MTELYRTLLRAPHVGFLMLIRKLFYTCNLHCMWYKVNVVYRASHIKCEPCVKKLIFSNWGKAWIQSPLYKCVLCTHAVSNCVQYTYTIGVVIY